MVCFEELGLDLVALMAHNLCRPAGLTLKLRSRHLFVRELRNARSLGCVFNCDGGDVALGVDVEQRVLVEIAGLRHWNVAKLDMQSVCFSEVPNSHGLNP